MLFLQLKSYVFLTKWLSGMSAVVMCCQGNWPYVYHVSPEYRTPSKHPISIRIKYSPRPWFKHGENSDALLKCSILSSPPLCFDHYQYQGCTVMIAVPDIGADPGNNTILDIGQLSDTELIPVSVLKCFGHVQTHWKALNL